jgi:hypothetical protein
MTTRSAACHCGQLRVTAVGDPVRISICHCLDCQRRTGSPFGFSAHYPRPQVSRIEGRSNAFTRKADSGNTVTFHFCPDCGSNVYWEPSGHPERITIAVGNFAAPDHAAPRHSVYESRMHHWVHAPDDAEHSD